MSHDDAVFEADSVIRRTMGDFSPENVSLFETGPAWARVFTMFYSFFNSQANLVGGEMQTAMRTMGWHGSGRMFWIYLWGVAVPAIVGDLISKGFKGELGEDDDDDGYLDEILDLTLGAQLRYVAGGIPIAGQLTTAIVNRFNDKFYDDKISTSPVYQLADRTVTGIANIGNLADPQKRAREVSDMITAFGALTGIPTGQLAKTAGYATSVASGTSKPEGVADVLQGVVSGRDGTEKKR